jgi:hypothetical protein
MVETLPYTYTTEEEITRVFSSTGVTLRIDDLDPLVLTDFWTEICSEATDIANTYLEVFYEPEDLNTSFWVRSRCKWIGAYLLSLRRGNPALFLQRYEEVLEDFQRVFQGELIIPRLPVREDFVPSMSNLVVDDRFLVQKLRIHPDISTGNLSSKQHISYYPAIDLL